MNKLDGTADSQAIDTKDLTPQAVAEVLGKKVSTAIERTGLMSVVEIKATLGRVHILGRVVDGDKKSFVQDFAKAVWERTTQAQVDIFVGIQYFPYKGDASNIKYGWVFAFAAEDMPDAARLICDAADAVSPRVEVMSAPLSGPSTPSGGKGRGRGAAPLRA